MTTTLETCRRHGLPLSKARRHFRWGESACRMCRENARKAAHKARRRDPLGIAFLRALYQSFETRPFTFESAALIAARLGFDERRTGRLLEDVGPGSFDPVTGSGVVGDGLLRVVSEEARARGLVVFAFDPVVGSVARLRAIASEATVSTVIAPLARPTNSGASAIGAATPAVRGILDRTSERRKTPACVLGPVDVAKLIELVTSDLEGAAERGEMLVRVSVTMPKWNLRAYQAAGHTFHERLVALGASGLLLALDRRDDGTPHYYGVVALPPRISPKATMALLRQAWVAASGAASDCVRFQRVVGWDAFAGSGGNLDVKVAKYSFRTNLSRVLAYTFKPWPAHCGARRARDVLEDGFFAGVTRACT